MQTLANILAGVPSDPTQVSPGLSPLIMQQLIASQIGQQAQHQGMMLQGSAQMPPQSPLAIGGGTGLGSMGQMALPMAAGIY